MWLAGSLVSSLFYAAVSFLGLGRWYPFPAAVGLNSALAATLMLADAPAQSYPGSYGLLAIVLASPSLQRIGLVTRVLGPIWLAVAHVVVVLSLTALVLIASTEPEGRWFLTVSLAIAAGFYYANAAPAERRRTGMAWLLSNAAITLTGGGAVSLVYVFDLSAGWYGPAIVLVGWLFALGSLDPAPSWFGRRYLTPLALLFVTFGWLALQPVHPDFPRHAAGVHFAAAGFYLLAARLAFRTDERGHRLGASIPDATLAAATTLWVPLLYAGALTLALGCWYLVEDVAGQAGASRSEVLWTFVALSLAVGAVGASMRFWWPAARGHTYLIAIGVSLFALVYAAELDGPVTEALVAFTATALALVLWEREPRALPVPAAYGLVLVLAAWRHFNPDDAYLPLALTGLAVLLFLASLAFRRLGGGWHLQLLLIAFAYAAIAPFAGWIALAQLADPGGFVGNEHFEKTSLYLTSALSVVALGLLMSSYALLVRSLEAGISASAVLMLAALLGIGRYSPENVQFYTAPLGAYLFVLGAVTTRLHALTDEWRAMLQPLVTLGPSVIMAPTFLQSLDADAWEYGVVLLAESLAFIGIAVVQRWSGLLAVSIGFLVLDGAHYLFFADGGEGATLPTWAILTMAGILVMLAGTAILFSRDRWSAWQRALRVWWYQDPRAG